MSLPLFCALFVAFYGKEQTEGDAFHADKQPQGEASFAHFVSTYRLSSTASCMAV